MKTYLIRSALCFCIPLTFFACSGIESSTGSPTASSARPLASRPVLDLPHTTDALRSAKAHTELGMGYVDLGRFDIALDEAQIALRADSNYSPAYHLLGMAYMMLKDSTQARDNFERALSLAPGDPEVSNTYGMFKCQNGEATEGLALLESAGRNPYYRYPTRALTNAGLCYLTLNDTNQAQSYFRRAAEVDPTNATALYHLASLLYQAKDYKEAKKAITQLHQNASTTSASAWMGYLIALKTNNDDERVSYAAQIKNRFPESEEYKWLVQGKTQ